MVWGWHVKICHTGDACGRTGRRQRNGAQWEEAVREQNGGGSSKAITCFKAGMPVWGPEHMRRTTKLQCRGGRKSVILDRVRLLQLTDDRGEHL